MKARRIVITSLVYLLIVSIGFAPRSVSSQTYNIIRVADSISNPELGLFNTALATPVIEGDYVVFRTLNSNGTAIGNIWSWNRKTKQYIKLVDLSMAAPGGTGNFTDLGAGLGGPVLRDGIVVFGARDSGSPPFPAVNTGIYSVPVTGGAIQRVANYNTAVPGGVGNFFNFSATSQHTGVFSFSDGIVGFEGDFGGGPIGNSGIYQSDIAGGGMVPIADSLHGIGDLFPITNFTHIAVDAGKAAFIGGNVFGFRAIYSTGLPASLPAYNEVITVDTVLPGAAAGFSFVTPSVRLFGEKIFFIALDGVNGGNNNRRTLYEIPFAGGTPTKIVSNYDALEGLSSIEQSSINSYDVNQNHILIRAKAPGSTPDQGLYLFDRATKTFRRIFTLNQTILDRSFGVLGEVQPGGISPDSSRVVAAIGGSALFVGPYGYIVMLSTDPDDSAPAPDDLVGDVLTEIESALAEAKKKLPPKPASSLSKSKKARINAKRKAISTARKTIADLIKTLIESEGSSGDSIRATLPNFTAKNLTQLKKQRNAGSSAKSSTSDAKKAWKKFGQTLKTLGEAA